MRRCTFLFLLTAFASFGWSEDPARLSTSEEPLLDVDEGERVSQLIEVTKRNLAIQEKLREYIFEFKKAQINFRQDSDNRELGAALIKSAIQVQEIMDKYSLSHLFRPDFLNEVRVIASMVNRKALPAPQ